MKFKLYYESKYIKVYSEDVPEYLYHATLEYHVPSIMEHGLLVCSRNTPRNYDWCNRGIYLTINPSMAESFMETSENDEFMEEIEGTSSARIVVFQIETKNLDLKYLFEDDNFQTRGESDEALSFIYVKNIPYKYLHEIDI